MSNQFEDVHITGIGNLREYSFLNINMLIEKLKDINDLKLITADYKGDKYYPKNITKIVKGENEKKINVWSYTNDSKFWIDFYEFDCSKFFEELKLKPAFIYKKEIRGGKKAFIPVVMLLLSKDNKIMQISESICKELSCAINANQLSIGEIYFFVRNVCEKKLAPEVSPIVYLGQDEIKKGFLFENAQRYYNPSIEGSTYFWENCEDIDEKKLFIEEKQLHLILSYDGMIEKLKKLKDYAGEERISKNSSHK